MKHKEEILAKKYAVAYLNVFQDSITEKKYEALRRAEEALLSYNHALFFMHIPGIEPAVKLQALQMLSDSFALGSSFDRLLQLLFEDQRFFLLPAVVQHIVEEYQHRTGRMTATLSSSHTLTTDQKHAIETFFAALVDKIIMYTYHRDPRLIAGIRLQSDTVMWEYSIDKQLRECKRELAKGTAWK